MLPWRIARYVLPLVFFTMISVGIALMAHSLHRPHPCSAACQRQYSWTKLPTGEIVGVGAGVGVLISVTIGGADAARRRLRHRGRSPASDELGVD